MSRCMVDILENLTHRIHFLEEEFDVVVPKKDQYWTMDESTGKKKRFQVTKRGDSNLETTILPDHVARPSSAKGKLNIPQTTRADKENAAPQRVQRLSSARTTSKEKEPEKDIKIRRNAFQPIQNTKQRRDPVVMNPTPSAPRLRRP